MQAAAASAVPLLSGAAGGDGEQRVFDDTGARVDDDAGAGARVRDDDGEADVTDDAGAAAADLQHKATVSAADEPHPSRMRRAWRGVRWFGSKLWAVGMKVGNYSAHFLGLHDSKYQDVVDYYEHMREIQRQRILRELHAAAQRISEVEAGQVQMSHAVVQPPNDDDRMRFIARAAVAVDDPLSTSAGRSSSPAPQLLADQQQQQQQQGVPREALGEGR